MIATATAEHYRGTIRADRRLGRDRCADRDLHPPAADPGRGRRGRDREAAEEMARDIPVQAVFMSPRTTRRSRAAGSSDPPLSRGRGSPLARVMRHVDWRDRPAEEPPDFEDVRADEAAALIADALESGATGCARDDGAPPRLLPDRDPDWRVAGGSRWAGGRPTSSVAGRPEGTGSGPRPQERDGRRAHRALRRHEVIRAAEEMDETIARAGRSGKPSSSRRWSRPASSCWSASSTTPPSARCLPAAREAPRPSCSRTWPSGSARSRVTTLNGCSARSRPFRS